MTIHRAVRLLSTVLIAAGALLLVWVVVVWRWEDPFTAIYTHFEQARLSHDYDKRVAAFEPKLKPSTAGHRDLAAVEREVAAEARAYGRTLHTGDPVGRIQIGRIGLKMVVVQGTDEESLKKGPGHYLTSGLPGEGKLIYIAGHRTTYLAPFAAINAIRIGDYVKLEMPYGVFTYRVTRHYIVPATALSILVNHNKEILRLQACHPRFFATHRYIVDARLVAVAPRGGKAYTLTSGTSPPRATGARS
jgi:sortase A